MNSCSTFHSVFFYIASLYFSTEFHSKRSATISDQKNISRFLVSVHVWRLFVPKQSVFKQSAGRCRDQRWDMRRLLPWRSSQQSVLFFCKSVCVSVLVVTTRNIFFEITLSHRLIVVTFSLPVVGFVVELLRKNNTSMNLTILMFYTSLLFV